MREQVQIATVAANCALFMNVDPDLPDSGKYGADLPTSRVSWPPLEHREPRGEWRPATRFVHHDLAKDAKQGTDHLFS